MANRRLFCLPQSVASKTWFTSLLPYLFILLKSGFTCTAQETGYTRFFGTEMGLSQGTNYSILRDSEQFLWITSEDGINRFDGTDFKNYYYEENKKGSPKGIIFAGIVEDSSKNLWIGSDKALNQYIRKTDAFTHFNDKGQTENYYIPFQIKGQQLYYFNAGKGILSRHIVNGQTQEIYTFKDHNNHNKYYQSYQYAFINTQDQLVIPLDYGIAIVHLKAKKIAHYYSLKQDNILGEPLTVYCLKKDKDDAFIWIGTEKGLILLNTTAHQARHFPLPGNPRDGEILSMEKDGDELYIGTASLGPLIFNTKTKQYARVPVDNEDFKFKGQIILGAYKDPQNILWFNLNPSGILAVSKTFKKFHKQQLQSHENRGTEVIRSFCESPDGNLWIGTQGAGIFIRDQKNGNTRPFEQAYHLPQPSLWIRHLLTDFKLNTTFIASEDGLYAFDHRQKTIAPFQAPPNFPDQALFVHHILALSDSLLLIGTKTGPFLANKINKTITPLPFLQGKNISYLFRDKQGLLYFNIWEASMVIYRYASNQWNYIKTIFPKFALLAAWQNPADDKFYFATNMGLLETTKNHLLLKQYTMANGLPNNFIYGFLADDNDRLWLSTNKGLSTFRLSTKSFRNFGPKDGLQGYEYNGKAFYKDHLGHFYFGGTNGYDYFDPQTIKDATYLVNVYVKRFLINNMPNVFPSYFNASPTIRLASHQNTFSITLGVTDFFSSENNMIKYKLENFDQDWILGTANSMIRYTQVPPGHYTFRFMAANKDGYWSPYEKSILFQINSPYYATWWFMMIVGLFLISILYLLYRYRINQLLRMERLKTRLSNDLHDDVGASLSAINIYTKMAEEKQDKSTYIQLIKTNTLQALDSINAMVWAIKPETQKLESLILKMKDFAIPLLEGQGIACVFTVHSSNSGLTLSPDFTKNSFLLFKESMNNIVKHAAASSTLIDVFVTKEHFILSIKDNGKGFNLSETYNKGNGLRTMYERSKAFNGDLQISSNVNKGTTLLLTVSLKNTTL